MSFYKLIGEQLNKAGLATNFERTDILEYMVLEAAGCLPALKDMPLKCVFSSGDTSNIKFGDNKQRSRIEIGFHNSTKPSTIRRLQQAFKKMPPRFTEFTYDAEHVFQNLHNTLYSFILLDEDIENAIKSSTLFIAAGNLTQLQLVDLLELREKIRFYKIYDSVIYDIADKLVYKISQHIDSTFNQADIDLATPSVSNKYKATQNILNQEQKFNELFFELEKQINDLKIKGAPQKKGNTFTPGLGHSYVPNPDFIPEYENIAIAADKLQTTIKKAQKAFFNNPPTEFSLKQFHDMVCEAIEEARPIFNIDPSAWDQLHPVLKGLLGVIAAITIIPAIVIEIVSPRGFIGTFFKTPKPDSLVKLESFEKDVCSENGVFDEIDKAIRIC